MKTILVVDDEKMILRLATEALKNHAEGFKVETALNGKQALHILNDKAKSVDLVLTDLKMPVMDGYELLSYMSRSFKSIPIIVMTGFGSAEIAKQLKQRGISYYIEKPFEITTLREKITEAFKSDKGSIRGFTLANFLQAVEVEEKTVCLRISSKGRIGFLHIYEGQIIDAETGELTDEDAAIEIICWDDTEIEMQTARKKKKIIQNSLMNILLQASKVKDEKKLSGPTGDELIKNAISKAEGHFFREAQKIVAAYLKKNPRSAQGWLWYSRIIASMKSIGASLSNAVKLAPVDVEINEETKRFMLAKKHIKVDQVRRCPFCWTPAEVKASKCLLCRSHFFIHKDFFSIKHDADREILEKAIERYTKVISREKNVNAYFYLSIAQLNLERWEEALNLFHKTVNLVPDKKVISNQLKILLDYMASTEQKAEQKSAPKEEVATEKEETYQDEDVKKKILVVEDSPTTRKVISITLGQKGYEIIEARDGLEALSRLNEVVPDLILLDIILPKMDGYKILDIIKKNKDFKDIPVIMLTSRDSFMSKVKGKLAGSTAYITKPFAPQKLVKTIEKYL